MPHHGLVPRHVPSPLALPYELMKFYAFLLTLFSRVIASPIIWGADGALDEEGFLLFYRYFADWIPFV